jgi:hypothetical protein
VNTASTTIIDLSSSLKSRELIVSQRASREAKRYGLIDIEDREAMQSQFLLFVRAKRQLREDSPRSRVRQPIVNKRLVSVSAAPRRLPFP